MRGRTPAGPEYVEKLSGTAEAKRRLELILRTVAGTCRVQDACEQMGLGEARFHQLRKEVLQAALDSLAPKPAGRPPAPEPDPRVGELEEELGRSRLELAAARTREEIALVLPRVLARGEGGEGKKPAGRRKGKARRPSR